MFYRAGARTALLLVEKEIGKCEKESPAHVPKWVRRLIRARAKDLE